MPMRRVGAKLDATATSGYSRPPEGLRYFEYHHSRAGEVVTKLLGERFKGVLISDFYGGYNDYACPHQWCWVHLLRDLQGLKEKQAKQEEVVNWVKQVKALYEQAVAIKAAGLAGEELTGCA